MPQRYLFLLSGEAVDLAYAEAKSVAEKGSGWKLVSGGKVASCVSPAFEHERLAFTKELFEVFAEGKDTATLRSWLSSHPHTPKGSVRVDRLVVVENAESVQSPEVRKLLLDWLGRPPIDIHAPDESYVIIILEEGFVVARKVWVNSEDFTSRKSHNRPAPHPTALHPKLARALINLSHAKKEVLDPFAGAGGILLEAGLMGIRSRGYDIDPAMVRRAKTNLAHFNVTDVTVKEADALSSPLEAETIVTDLPYGKNSKAGDLETLYSSFLEKARPKNGRIVVAFPSTVDAERIAVKTGWMIVDRFVWRLHKTLEKVIFVLERK